MTIELTVPPNIISIGIDGDRVRATRDGLVCLRDVLDAIDIKRTDDWIGKLNAVSNRIEYHDIGQPKPAAFIDELGLIEILARSRKEKAKAKLLNIISRTRSHNEELLRSLTERIEKLERGGAYLLLKPVPDISLRSQLNMIIRRFVARQQEIGFTYSYPDAWRELYYQHKYRYHRDIRAGAKLAQCDALDYAEKRGFLQQLIDLANHIFRPVDD